MHDDEMASHPDEYWERRREITPSPNPPMVADGDQRLALVINLTGSQVVPEFGRLRNQLGAFECLKPTPLGELHITIKLFDHTPASTAKDGSSPVSATRITDAVIEIIDEHEPFDVEFPRLNLFPDTVYAEVEGNDELLALNEALCECPWTATSDRDSGQFIPHLTIGHFTGTTDYEQLISFLEANRDPQLPVMTVEEVAIVAYDLTSNWGSAATTLQTYPL